MGHVAKFIKGQRTLELNGNFSLTEDFRPPVVNMIANMAGGTSANKYGGEVKVSERAMNIFYSFAVKIEGSSVAEVDFAKRLLINFLRQAGVGADPLYFAYRPDNNVDCEPVWGQFGASWRLQVEHASWDIISQYGVGTVRERYQVLLIELQCRPGIHGISQRLLTAKGGILENNIGTVDGRSRGINLSYDATNLVTNPIFGQSTWDDGWTASGSLTATQSTNPEYVLFGTSSARLETTADDQYLETSVTMSAGTTYTVSCYIKMRDKSTPTTAQIEVRIVGGGTPTFREIGDGWWMAYRSYTPAGTGAVSVGLQINSDVSVYFGGMQVESRSIPSLMVHGDMLGCSWSGTAHDSASYRSDPMLRMAVSSLMYKNNFTIRLAWIPDYDDTFGTTCYFFDSTGANEIQASIASGTVTFKCGAVTLATGSAMDFSVGDRIIIHFVAEPGRVQIYWNGTQVASTGSYDVPYPSTYLYIGSDTSLANPINGTIAGFTTFDKAMSSTEVAADYANAAEMFSGGDEVGQMVDALPWLWTKDGDDVIDNCDDSTRDNYAVIGGVPGSLPADSYFYIDPAAYTTYYLVHAETEEFVRPNEQYYYDAQGSADAGCSGGEYQGLTSSYGYASFAPTKQLEFKKGKDVHFFARAKMQAGPNFINGTLSYAEVITSSLNIVRADFITAAQDTTFNLYYLNKVNSEDISGYDWTIYAGFEHSSGQTYLDYFMAVPGNVMKITGLGVGGEHYIHDRTVIEAGVGWMATYASGDRIQLMPNRFNYLWFLQGTNSDTSTITSTATFNKVEIIPHWAVG